jgi:hypothetical protein
VYNDVIATFTDGSYLWTNMIDWLTQYLSNITVYPTVTQPPLLVSTGDLNIVLIISIVVLPGIVLVAGGWVWWTRSRRQ